MTTRNSRPFFHASALLGAAVVAPACAASKNPATPHTHDHAHGGHAAFQNANEWTGVFDDPSRDEWQRPADVIRALNLSPSMNVADIGAGTGYFSVRLARAVPQGNVFATDIEPDMVRFLTERAEREHLPNLVARAATKEGAGLEAASVDRILIVNVWHHIDNRTAYARNLATALRPGGKIVIVDFNLTAHHGPPREMRLAPDAILSELNASGLRVSLSPIALPDQYIVVAER